MGSYDPIYEASVVKFLHSRFHAVIFVITLKSLNSTFKFSLQQNDLSKQDLIRVQLFKTNNIVSFQNIKISGMLFAKMLPLFAEKNMSNFRTAKASLNFFGKKYYCS